jgi:hypothetical protein
LLEYHNPFPSNLGIDFQNELKAIGSKITEANPALMKTVAKLQKKK